MTIGPSDPAPSISVAMATCNGARFVGEQIASILPQLGPADELVISDDSSSDDTLALIRGLRHPRIRILEHPPPRSPAANFEHALRQTGGGIIVLADQDDVWLPNKLPVVRERFAAEAARPYLIVLDAEVVDEADHVLVPSVLTRLGAGPGFFRNLYANRYIGCCLAFSRDLLAVALPFPRDLPMHDMWLGQLCHLVGRTDFVHTVTMRYRRHAGALTDFAIHFEPLTQIRRRWRLLRTLGFRYLRHRLWG